MSDMDKLADVLVNGEPSKFDRVKAKIKEHKEFIAGISIGVVVGATAVLLHKSGNIQVINKNKIENSPHATIKYITQTVVQANFGKRGRPGTRIQHVQTGRLFGSLGEAAEELGLNYSDISRQVNGKKNSVKGNTFIKLVDSEKNEI